MSGDTARTSVSGKSVVVIGGSSGVGRERSPARPSPTAPGVTITGRDRHRLATASTELGGVDRVVDTAALDAHDEGALQAFFTEVGRVDHIVSLVGDSMSGGFLATTAETMRHVLDSKFVTNWLIARRAARVLRNGGSLTFTSGTGGRPHDVSATYVSNLAIHALVQGLAYEMAPGHRVNAVAPTFMGTRTGFWRDVPTAELIRLEEGFADTVPLRRMAQPGEVAAAYLHLLTNDFITGQVLAVDGGVMLAK